MGGNRRKVNKLKPIVEIIGYGGLAKEYIQKEEVLNLIREV